MNEGLSGFRRWTIFTQKRGFMTHLLALNYEELNNEIDYDALLSLLSKSRCERLSSMKNRPAKLPSIMASLLLSYGLKTIYDLDEKTLSYKYLENGKPVFSGLDSLHFNLSHSGKAVLLALSDSPVGCDIQEPRKSLETVAKRYFSSAELSYLSDHKDDLLSFWTAKEAYIKLTGKGMKQSLDSFLVDFLKFPKEISANNKRLAFLHTFSMDSYAISVVNEKDQGVDFLPISYCSFARFFAPALPL